MTKRILAAALVLALLLTSAAAFAEREIPACEPGDTILYGSFEQNGLDDGPEPIEWIVLDTQDGAALLLSRYLLTFRRVHSSADEPVHWAESDLRAWLNGEFLDGAFTEEEAEGILTADVENAENAAYGTPGGPDTEDRIFLPGIGELDYYLPEQADRAALPTYGALIGSIVAAAEAQPAFIKLEEMSYEESENWPVLYVRENVLGKVIEVRYGFSEDGTLLVADLQVDGGEPQHTEAPGNMWWLRSPADSETSSAYVNADGALEELEGTAVTESKGIRPMMWIEADTGN